MNISPVAPGACTASNPDEGMSAGAERMARAIAIASGQDPQEAQTAIDLQVELPTHIVKRIKVSTQSRPDSQARLEELPLDAPQSDTLADYEQAQAASEDTRPLSPQFAALAKQKRALQRKEKELLAKELALDAYAGDRRSLGDHRARLKADALKVLGEEGVGYDPLTEQVLGSNDERADLSGIRAEIQAMKDALVDRNRFQDERDAQAEKLVLAQIERETNQLISRGDDFEMIREAGYGPKVVELIYRNFKETGELLDVPEAANLIEQELLEEGLKFAKLKKVQSRLNPALSEQRQAVQKDRPGTKTMRTLTNRDGGSSLSMSKRARAIAAMEGRLK